MAKLVDDLVITLADSYGVAIPLLDGFPLAVVPVGTAQAGARCDANGPLGRLLPVRKGAGRCRD